LSIANRYYGSYMGGTKALCLFTTILGHKTMVRKLTTALDKIPGLTPVYVFTEVEDYARYPAPWWARASDPWHGQYLAQQKVKPVLSQEFDILLVNAWDLAAGFRDLARRMPAAAVMDAIPATFDYQLRLQGANGWKRSLAHKLHNRSFQLAAREFDVFVPMGSDCAESLQRDYGVEPGKCTALTLAPQDLEISSPPYLRNHTDGPTRLLFVGKDFFRKGGEFLLRLFAQHLSNKCRLTIVSSDAGLDGRELPPGVERFTHISLEELRDLYRTSHIFVFPTQQDFMPQVLAEALAFGLPCISNDVGGVKDLVQDGENGIVFSRDSTVDQWAERLHRLISNPAELAAMSLNARYFAERELSFDRFEKLIADVVERLRLLKI
jgi:glycosyltransferase involved in cell wall biosynthesis